MSGEKKTGTPVGVLKAAQTNNCVTVKIALDDNEGFYMGRLDGQKVDGSVTCPECPPPSIQLCSLKRVIMRRGLQ